MITDYITEDLTDGVKLKWCISAETGAKIKLTAIYKKEVWHHPAVHSDTFPMFNSPEQDEERWKCVYDSDDYE